jgi:hypothetical protein
VCPIAVILICKLWMASETWRWKNRSQNFSVATTEIRRMPPWPKNRAYRVLDGLSDARSFPSLVCNITKHARHDALFLGSSDHQGHQRHKKWSQNFFESDFFY